MDYKAGERQSDKAIDDGNHSTTANEDEQNGTRTSPAPSASDFNFFSRFKHGICCKIYKKYELMLEK